MTTIQEVKKYLETKRELEKEYACLCEQRVLLNMIKLQLPNVETYPDIIYKLAVPNYKLGSVEMSIYIFIKEKKHLGELYWRFDKIERNLISSKGREELEQVLEEYLKEI